MPVQFKYVAQGGQFVQGVPARDLSEDEVRALNAEQHTACLESGCYEPVVLEVKLKVEKPPKKKKVKEGEE